MEETATFEKVTPDMAQRLLEENYHNRPLNKRNLNGIIYDVERENFMQTGESVKISVTNKLLDGQHRLWAIIKTNTPLRLLIIRNLQDDAFKYIDTGKRRTPADVLAIEGVKNSSKIAAISRFIVNFERGSYVSVAKHTRVQRNDYLSNSDISLFVEKHKEDLYESYLYGFNEFNKIISGVTLAAFHYLFNKISERHADEFCHKLAEGSDLHKTDPIKVLRDIIIADIRSTRKMSQLEKMALICKGWNHYRKEENISKLKWDSIKEPFPKPL